MRATPCGLIGPLEASDSTHDPSEPSGAVRATSRERLL